ncbi:MAG: hypothetical protein JWO06_1359 [Bacteroidota bacterium]|nr:hypothetical protein [Bacteroidota bacterium]
MRTGFKYPRIFCADEIGVVFQKIQESQVSITFQCSGFNCGFEWLIGDVKTGYPPLPPEILNLKDAVEFDCDNIEDNISLLAYAVALIYPDSAFAEWYHDHSEYIEIQLNPN